MVSGVGLVGVVGVSGAGVGKCIPVNTAAIGRFHVVIEPVVYHHVESCVGIIVFAWFQWLPPSAWLCGWLFMSEWVLR